MLISEYRIGEPTIEGEGIVMCNACTSMWIVNKKDMSGGYKLIYGCPHCSPDAYIDKSK